MRYLVLCLLCLFPAWTWATSTSGGTSRAVLIDGIVSTGATPGSNLLDWETDEVFEGFSAIVNWYMTWDDDNLYLGRVGGNNAEGSVLYILAGYPGADQTNQAFDYDGLRPDLAPMGGINFTAYLRDTYDEFRTYNGGWSPPVISLNPLFTNQPNGSNMEVAIPWNVITNGNGRPANFRAVMYQVVPGGVSGCPGGGPFVYGESPWGTGNANDGPSLGVNDGAPTSARQPGGCDVGDSTATRWWGCYPVIGGVGVNGWNAVQPNAGLNDTICESATSFILQGNVPGATAVGTWSNIGQPPGANLPNFVNANAPNSIVQGLTSLGTYSFGWDINYNGCPSIPDTVEVTRVAAPTFSEAGPDQDLACDLDNATLDGSDPGVFDGAWSLVSGNGLVVDPDSEMSAVTGLAYGANVFRWSVSSPGCPAITDTVTLWRYQPVNSLAGVDQQFCNQSMAMLAGIDPNFFGGQPSGNWQQTAGPSGALISDASNNTATVSNLESGEYSFVWTLTNGTCPSSSDTVDILIYEPPMADAGADQFLCLTETIQLFGNDMSSLGDSAFFFWSQLSGPSNAQILDSTQANTLVSGLEAGEYKFAWTVGNGNCPVENDVVTITLSDLTANGFVQTQLASPLGSDGVVEINPPSNGTPPYEYSLDGITFQGSNVFSGLSAGNYEATILDDNGCEVTLSIDVLEDNVAPPPDSLPIVVPTGFSPNGDDVNDFWVLENIALYPEATVEVYNSWGQVVFRSVGYVEQWNGQYQDQTLPAATYYFVVDPKVEGQEIQKGPVTIFR